MKKFLVPVLALSLSAGILSAFAAVPTQPQERIGYVSVNATANKDLSPDVAELSIIIETTDSKSMQKATIANKEISDKVYATLKTMITPANGDYVKTSDFSASPEYRYSGNKQVLDKYRVSNNVIVKTKSIDKVGEMIDKSITLGAKSVGNLTFSVSKYDAECEELLSQASKKAYAHAKIITQASPSAIVGISNMSASCSGNSSRQPARMMMKAMAMDVNMEAAAPEESYTVIEAGTLKLNANVSATYFAK